MAIRIDSALLRGEIDNTQPGRVTGTLWLLDHDEPVTLDLQGDAWRDVAGTRLTFTHSQPAPQFPAVRLHPVQKGIVGDITASRKVKVIVPPEKPRDPAAPPPPPDTRWTNSLYIEWFSATQGRIVIETTSCQLALSPHQWQLDPDEEGAQKMANQQAMRDFLAAIIQRPEESSTPPPAPDHEPFSEEDWEHHLQQADRLETAHMEAAEKYDGDPEEQGKTAFVMGWDHLLSGPLGNDEPAVPEWLQGIDNDESHSDGFGAIDDDDMSDDDEDDDEDLDALTEEEDRLDELMFADLEDRIRQHPLQQRAQQLAVDLIKLIDPLPQDPTTSDPAHPLHILPSRLLRIAGKLAGALNTAGPERLGSRGYTTAILSRCLTWADEADTALHHVGSLPATASVHAALPAIADRLRQLTADMHALRATLRTSP